MLVCSVVGLFFLFFSFPFFVVSPFSVLVSASAHPHGTAGTGFCWVLLAEL
jgi:hypothetical protein